MWMVARSISRTVSERLNQGRFVARVLAVFERACDLVTPDGDVVALVLPSTGDGPLNVVVRGAPGLFAEIDPGAPATLDRDRLQIGGLRVDLRTASVWEPRPDWDTLRARRAAMVSHLSLLRTLCCSHAPPNTFLFLLDVLPQPGDGLDGATFSTAKKAAQSLREGWSGDPERLPVGVTGLAGLGQGLTPAGDDFLAGVMLWAWLAHPAPNLFCRTLVQAAIPRTTTLSAAFLRAAARGECSAAWQRLLAALNEGTEVQIAVAVEELLAHGATSGADSLSGFLYLGT